jgi:hypothetical protein
MKSPVALTLLILAALVGFALLGPDATATEVAGCASPAVGSPNCSLPYGSVGCSEPAAASCSTAAAPVRYRRVWFPRRHARVHATYAAPATFSACPNCAY